MTVIIVLDLFVSFEIKSQMAFLLVEELMVQILFYHSFLLGTQSHSKELDVSKSVINEVLN